MPELGSHLFERLAKALAGLTVALACFAYLSADAESAGRADTSLTGGTAGIGRGHNVQATRGGAAHSGFSAGLRGGSGRQFHSGVARPPIHHHPRSPSFGHHRLHHRSFFFFNLGGFAPYFPYPYSYNYQPYPYNPPYPAYPIAYDAAYPGVSAPYPYPDPVGAYPQPSQGSVQVYTAPPELAPVALREPVSQTQENPPPLPPLDDGSLRFEVDPAEAKVFIDGRYLGEAHELRNIAEIPASAGRHLLEIRVGTESSFTAVTVSPGKVTPVRVTLSSAEAAPEPFATANGRLRLQVTPPGAAVYLDGVFSNVAGSPQPASLILSPGLHRVQVVMPGFKEYSASVLVPRGGEAIVSVQLSEE